MSNDERKTLPLQVKVTPETKEKIGQRAKAADLNVSEYIRVAALRVRNLCTHIRTICQTPDKASLP